MKEYEVIQYSGQIEIKREKYLLDNEIVITNSAVDRLVTRESSEILPNTFSLEQNYPNPFNPSTVINYSIPVGDANLASHPVILKIYDILGNEIKTLVNEVKRTGTYEITWNADNLPSGVYFYRLQAGDFIQTKKMILMK